MTVKKKFTGTLFIVATFVKMYSQESIINQGLLLSKSVTHDIKYYDTRKEIEEQVVLKNEMHKFIFDTGAPFCISKEIQAKNDYKILHKFPISDATDRKDTVIIVEVDTFVLGKIKIANIPALVIDFKNSPIGCQDIEGIIGSNVARFFVVRFDVLKKKVRLTNDPEKIKEIPMDDPKSVFLDHQSNAFFEVSVSGGFKDTVHFDSGKSSFYDINFKAAKVLIESQKPKHHKGQGLAGQGIFGTGESEDLLRIKAPIYISNVLLENVVIKSTQAKSRIGREALNYGVMTIDYMQSKYAFDKYPNISYQTIPFYGFDIISENKKLVAAVVWENTPASRHGLVSGNEILSINGKQFKHLNSCEIDAVLQTELKKKAVQIEFLSYGKSKNIEVKRIKN